MRRLLNITLIGCAFVALFSFNAPNAFAACAVENVAGEPLRMLVLGDSIMWGQGLRPEEKFSARIKCWLQEKTGRPVQQKVEAHSGAVISAGALTNRRYQSTDGEVNLAYPTVNEQLDHALEFYGEQRGKVDLVLVDGCVNDVDVGNLLNATTQPDWLQERITARCQNSMQELLTRITNGFPNAFVFVTSYYRIVSSDTADNAFIRLLVKKLNNVRPEARRMTDKEMRARLIELSELWYRASTASLNNAVNATNAALREKGLPAQVTFVEVDFGPEHTFAASDTLLWNFIFASTNLSGLRKFIVILSFGGAAYKPNDDVRENRIRSCKQTFKAPKGVEESPADKSFRKDSLLICRYASLGHPNQMGALIYAEAIKGHLRTLIEKAGWKR